MKIVLTGYGSFANAYLKHDDAAIASIRELGKSSFIKRLIESDVIIHNAATINSSDEDLLVERNFDFTRFVIKVLEDHNPSAHLILLSSMSMLDASNDKAYANVLSMSPYAYSKYLAETFCLRSSLAHISSVRFSTLFYRDPEKDGLSKLVFDATQNGNITIYDHGQAERNFLPVDVAAQYTKKISRLKEREKRTYTIAAPHSIQFSEVATILKDCLSELQVTDLPSATKSLVLSKFHLDDIRLLGQIDFSIRDEIISYVQELSN